MSGIFGDHPMDRYFEKQLDEYLDSREPDDIYLVCDACGYGETVASDELDQADELICPECGKQLKQE